MASERLLLVDDDEALRSGLGLVLEAHGFDVSLAEGTSEALRLISNQQFDVLLTDLHMPGPSDGLTVISAMRHVHPAAVTLLLSADPNLAKATATILRQVDEVILKPAKASFLVERIRQHLHKAVNGWREEDRPATPAMAAPEDEVAGLLEAHAQTLARTWLAELERPGPRDRPSVALTPEERTEHLPEALRDIVFRLRYPQPPGASTLFSMSALQHGARRRRQGVGAATLGEETRALQVAIFRLITDNQERIEPGRLAAALMAIADELSAQLLQALQGYENEEPAEPGWGFR